MTKNQLALGYPVLFVATDAAEIALAAALASEQGSEDAIDKAIRESIADKEALKAYELKKFVPFDPVAKRAESQMSGPDGKAVHFSKGAPQVIIALCALDVARRRIRRQPRCRNWHRVACALWASHVRRRRQELAVPGHPVHARSPA